MITSELAWSQLVDQHRTALSRWQATNDRLLELPAEAELNGQEGRDHEQSVASLDAAEDALLEAVPPSTAGIAYQFKVAAERYYDVFVEDNAGPNEPAVEGAVLRRVYAALLGRH